MIFYSMPFLLFFTLFLLIFSRCRTRKAQNLLILCADILFYAWWDVRFLLLLFLVIGLCYFFGLRMGKSRNRLLIILPVAACLIILGIFKYMNFFIDSYCSLLKIQGDHTLNLILPLGISFYLFEAISYLLDVRAGVIPPEKDFIKLAAYISFFPQITSGPIAKARDFLPQLNEVHTVTRAQIYSGLQQFTLGLMKKLVFADNIAVSVNAVFAAPGAYSGLSILFAVLGYSLQIYFDFSGYSDMAIGLIRMMGFHAEVNFNLPYLAGNPSEFWKRWHISLSSWFQTYVYIPLGGSRKGTLRTYLNLMITMLLSGLWHGASWTFVLWGFFHGLGSIVYKFVASRKKQRTFSNTSWISAALNFLFVSLLWVIFRAQDLSQAMAIFGGLFRLRGIGYISVFTVAGILFLAICSGAAVRKNGGNTAIPDFHLDTFRGKVLYCSWILLILVLMHTGSSPFIYAQF